MNCQWHCCNNELKGKQTKFCSVNCKRTFFVTQNRRKMKERAVSYKGGKCEMCGYAKCIRALSFHHKDPEKKDFGISAMGICRSWETIRKELDKCILLCANCHAEVENLIHSEVR